MKNYGSRKSNPTICECFTNNPFIEEAYDDDDFSEEDIDPNVVILDKYSDPSVFIVAEEEKEEKRRVILMFLSLRRLILC